MVLLHSEKNRTDYRKTGRSELPNDQPSPFWYIFWRQNGDIFDNSLTMVLYLHGLTGLLSSIVFSLWFYFISKKYKSFPQKMNLIYLTILAEIFHQIVQINYKVKSR